MPKKVEAKEEVLFTNILDIYTQRFSTTIHQVEVPDFYYNPESPVWNICCLINFVHPMPEYIVYNGLTLFKCVEVAYRHFFGSVFSHALLNTHKVILDDEVQREEFITQINEKISHRTINHFKFLCKRGCGWPEESVQTEWNIASQEFVVEIQQYLKQDLSKFPFKDVFESIVERKDAKKRYANLNKQFNSIFDKKYPQTSNYQDFFEFWQFIFREKFLLQERLKDINLDLELFSLDNVAEKGGRFLNDYLMLEILKRKLFNCYWVDDNLLNAFIHTDVIPNGITFKKVIDQGVFFFGEEGLDVNINGTPNIIYWVSFFQIEKDARIQTGFLSSKDYIEGIIYPDWHETLDLYDGWFQNTGLPIMFEQTLYLAKILLQILLYMQQEPEDRQREYITAQRPYKNTKNKNEVPQYKPIVIGEGYQIKTVYQRSHSSESGEKGSPKSPHWRRGHYRNQMFGAREKPQHKTVWIEPRFIQGSRISEEKSSEAI